MENIKNDRKLILLLESRVSAHTSPPPKTGLKKRLSPLRYPGGKSRVIDQIYNSLDEKKLRTFVEVFAGGASLGLSLLKAGKTESLILNELDPFVFNFWDVVLHKPDELLTRIKTHLPTMEDYFQAKQMVLKSAVLKNLCDSEAAFNFLILNRMSFGGVILANPLCGKDGTDDELRARWTPKTLVQRIETIANLADKITLKNMDAIEFLKRDTVVFDKEATIFIDPPYTVAGKKLYVETFENRHQELATVINDLFGWYLVGADFVLTYDDCSLIRNLYPNAEVKELVTSWSIFRDEK